MSNYLGNDPQQANEGGFCGTDTISGLRAEGPIVGPVLAAQSFAKDHQNGHESSLHTGAGLPCGVVWWWVHGLGLFEPSGQWVFGALQ